MKAFTLIEVIAVTAIIGIAASAVVIMAGGTNHHVPIAARQVMDDLMYAQNIAISQQKRVFVVFRPIDGSEYPGYDLTYRAVPTDANDWLSSTVRGPSVRRFGKYGKLSVNSASDWVQHTNAMIRPRVLNPSSGAMSTTHLTAVQSPGNSGSLGAPPLFSFDSLGQPCDGSGAAMATPILLTVTRGEHRSTITIQPITGEVTTN